ncbi:MAG: FAD-dependent oxidoreductase, partial [Flavobacteriaceae bacterium]
MKKATYLYVLVLPLLLVLPGALKSQSKDAGSTADIIIYGGTSAAIIAAVEAKQSGKSVLVVSPDVHLGGLTSGGLGWTDTGDKSVIGGLAKE